MEHQRQVMRPGKAKTVGDTGFKDTLRGDIVIESLPGVITPEFFDAFVAEVQRLVINCLPGMKHQALIRDIQLRRPAGPRLLQTKLMQKGLNSKLIEQLIKETAADRDDFDAAMSMAKKKVNSLKRLPVQKARQRLYGQLTRRGFEYDTVSQVMENLDWDNWADGDAVDPWE